MKLKARLSQDNNNNNSNTEDMVVVDTINSNSSMGMGVTISSSSMHHNSRQVHPRVMAVMVVTMQVPPPGSDSNSSSSKVSEQAQVDEATRIAAWKAYYAAGCSATTRNQQYRQRIRVVNRILLHHMLWPSSSSWTSWTLETWFLLFFFVYACSSIVIINK